MVRGRKFGRFAALAAVLLVPALAVVAVPSGVASAATTSFHPITPVRIMDTRAGVGTTAAPLAAGETRALQVVGQAAIPADAVAVAVNVTVTEPTSSGYVTLWPAGATMPTRRTSTSWPARPSPTWSPSASAPAAQVDLFNYAGDSPVLVDVTGWYTSGFTPIVPVRVMDTRAGLGGTSVQPGEGRELDLAAAAVPPAATGVVANVTVAGTTAATYLTVWPAGSPMPTASNVNAVPGQTVANMVTVGLGADGNDRHLQLRRHHRCAWSTSPATTPTASTPWRRRASPTPAAAPVACASARARRARWPWPVWLVYPPEPPAPWR